MEEVLERNKMARQFIWLLPRERKRSKRGGICQRIQLGKMVWSILTYVYACLWAWAWDRERKRLYLFEQWQTAGNPVLQLDNSNKVTVLSFIFACVTERQRVILWKHKDAEVKIQNNQSQKQKYNPLQRSVVRSSYWLEDRGLWSTKMYCNVSDHKGNNWTTLMDVQHIYSRTTHLRYMYLCYIRGGVVFISSHIKSFFKSEKYWLQSRSHVKYI